MGEYIQPTPTMKATAKTMQQRRIAKDLTECGGRSKVHRSAIKSKLLRFVKTYIREEMDTRVTEYVDHHLRDFREISSRQLATSLPDTVVCVRNLGSWVSKKCGGPDFSISTYAEDRLTAAFLRDVFRPRTFQRRFKEFVANELINRETVIIEALTAKLQENGLNRADILRKLQAHLELATRSRRVMGFTTKLALDVAVASAVSGKLTHGMGSAIGTATAQNVYIANTGFFSAIWAKFFGFPAWVTALGSAAGASVAAVIVTPLLGSAIEWTINNTCDIEAKIRRSYPKLARRLVYERPEGGHANLLEQTVRLVGAMKNCASGLKSISRSV